MLAYRALDGRQRHHRRSRAEEWQAALAGVFWRVGQHYREFARRKGHEEAREVLRQAMNTLWW